MMMMVMMIYPEKFLEVVCCLLLQMRSFLISVSSHFT